MKVLVKIPTRERGFDWLHHYTDNAVLPDTRFLISVDEDDPQQAPNIPGVTIVTGTSKNKIDAINRDINEYGGEWDLLIVGSDDMRPEMRGYDKFLADHMQKTFPDLDGCLWLPTEDSTPHKRGGHRMIPGSPAYQQHWICMLPIMGRTYYERFKYVYHPDYVAFWCDNEQTRVAQKLGKMRFINEPDCVRHYHPAWHNEGVEDSLYGRSNPFFLSDQQTFNRRQRRGFPI